MENTINTICLKAHNFWSSKAQFELDKDIYSTWTVFAVEEGRFAYQIGEKSGEAGYGDLVICPPNQWFHRRTIEPLTFHYIHYDIETNSPEVVQPPLPSGTVTIWDTARLSSCYDYLRRITDRSDSIAMQWKQHLFQDIIHLYQIEQALRHTHQLSASTVHDDMLWARDYIKRKAFGQVSMRNLADELNITPVQLTRRFRADFRMTPTEYLTKIRIERVCCLLEETTRTIDEIAQMVGYENGFYLSRVFSHHKAMSPSAYRKMRIV
ncbi:helix-turn-helix domain-containing protein [Paenibacillus chungangensis]|uniref:Helix-turn-helix domain-containing protein n=1 Tax=Paenibacillus chungangensis TaxID=696535 RepID=A0ABW3HQY2_9BACL